MDEERLGSHNYGYKDMEPDIRHVVQVMEAARNKDKEVYDALKEELKECVEWYKKHNKPLPITLPTIK